MDVWVEVVWMSAGSKGVVLVSVCFVARWLSVRMFCSFLLRNGTVVGGEKSFSLLFYCVKLLAVWVHGWKWC